MFRKLLTVIGLIALGVLGRLLPHPPNTTPITGIAFASSRYVGRFAAFSIPIAAMLISDAYIGWYDYRILISVYLSFGIISALSLWGRKSRGYFATTLLLLSSSIIFFLSTNFSVWLFSPWYEKSLSGLLYCYLLGLPFMRNMLLGDLLFGGALLSFANVLEISYFSGRISLKTFSSPSSAKA